MALNLELLSQGSTWNEVGGILLRLGLGVLLAFAIGFEREYNGRPAGIRTHMLVALGAMLFTEVGKSFETGDPSRVAAQVVTGVGFLGAGTILRMGGEVKGLTTAASVWATAAIGMAVASGGKFMIVAVAATILVLITLALVDDLQRRIMKEPRQDLLRIRTTSRSCLPAILDHLHAQGMQVRSTQIHSDEGEYEMVIEVEPKKAHALSVGSAVEDVKSARWSD